MNLSAYGRPIVLPFPRIVLELPYFQNNRRRISAAGFTGRSSTPMVTKWGYQFIASTKHLAPTANSVLRSFVALPDVFAGDVS
jgi:hypothetical protein